MRLSDLKHIRLLFGMLIMASGLAGVERVTAQELREEKNGFFSIAEDTIQLVSLPKRTLSIRSAVALGGRLVIRAHSDSSLIVRFTVRARAANKRKAFEFISSISVREEATAQETELQFRCPNPPLWRGNSETGTVEATIFIPVGSQLLVDAQLFDAEIVGPFKRVRVVNSLGRIVVADVEEFTEVQTANQRLTATNLRGAVRLSTTNATLEAIGFEITGNVPAVIQNDGGDIIIRNASGPLDVKDAFGRIQLIAYELGSATSTISGQANPIQVELQSLSSGQLIIANQDEDIELTLPDEASVALLLRVSERGSIEATDFQYLTEAVERTRMALRLGKGESEINATIKGQGNIYVRRGQLRELVEEEER